MYKKILEIIKQYDSIIITRHFRPDLDALGSQLGLKSLITDNFKDKKVYVVGDMTRPCFLGNMDKIDDDLYEKSLLIITDTSVIELLPEMVKYQKAKDILVIDHHSNECNLDTKNVFYDKKASAACQIIADFAFNNDLYVSEKTATCLYSGIISDTNRFNFGLSTNLFQTVAKLLEINFNYADIYNIMYSDKVSNLKMKAYFIDKFVTTQYGLAYIKSTKDIFNKFNVDLYTISRGMINVMSNLEGIEIWANFTQDPQTDKIVCEFRSKKIDILPIAIKYGGGGHHLACGATVDSFDQADKIIEDFNNLLKGS